MPRVGGPGLGWRCVSDPEPVVLGAGSASSGGRGEPPRVQWRLGFCRGVLGEAGDGT
jgi:hypothetical protein